MYMFCVTHQGLVGTLENVAHILTGTRLRMVPTDESKMVGLLDTLRQSQDKRGNWNKSQRGKTKLLDLCIQSTKNSHATP